MHDFVGRAIPPDTPFVPRCPLHGMPWLAVRVSLGIPGVKLAAGTYHVTPKIEDGNHLYFPCNDRRITPFEIDLSGCLFYLTVRPPPLRRM